MGALFGMYVFFVFSLVVLFVFVFAVLGTAWVRRLFIGTVEWALYAFVFFMMLAGGFMASPLGALLGQGYLGLAVGMIVGALTGLVLSVPIVAFMLLHIDIAHSSRKAAGLPPAGQV